MVPDSKVLDTLQADRETNGSGLPLVRPARLVVGSPVFVISSDSVASRGHGGEMVWSNCQKGLNLDVRSFLGQVLGTWGSVDSGATVETFLRDRKSCTSVETS